MREIRNGVDLSSGLDREVQLDTDIVLLLSLENDAQSRYCRSKMRLYVDGGGQYYAAP